MPPEIIALIDKPHLLIAVLFVGIMMGMTVEQLYRKWKRADWERRNRNCRPKRDSSSSLAPIADAADQLRIVMNARFKTRPLLKPKRKPPLR